MATFASNGNFATSAMQFAFSLTGQSTTSNLLFQLGTEKFSLARPSYYHNPLSQQGTEESDDDFDLEFDDDFTIISNKDDSLDPVVALTRSLSSLQITTTLPSGSKSISTTQSLRSTGNNHSKAAPKGILKKPKGNNDHTKPKKAVVWHPELAHDIVNGDHVPQTQVPREIWYPQEKQRIDAEFEAEYMRKLQILASTMEADAEADAEWLDVSDVL
ncbi:hypothetical protein PG993_014374 [Apiospora rasikravindrae]|uniref:Uncharacterized protein n=1 Tax=Apiospora rasikravindrae TaxID=990691 RepID=A0ABR1RMJ7_9PEZI